MNDIIIYVCKCITKFNKGNHVILWQDNHTGQWILGENAYIGSKLQNRAKSIGPIQCPLIFFRKTILVWLQVRKILLTLHCSLLVTGSNITFHLCYYYVG